MSEPLDTHPDVEARYRGMMRTKSPSERVVMACGMLDVARAAVLASLPAECDERAWRVHLFVRMYGRDFDAETSGRIVARLAK
jgi:hypothetical protein